MKRLALPIVLVLVIAARQSPGHGSDSVVVDPSCSASPTSGAPATVMDVPTLSAAANCTCTCPAAASPFDGPLCERSALFGSVFGARDSLADNGITVNVDNYEFYQGVASGGVRDSFQYSGRNDYFVNVNGEKAGLWEGLFIDLHGETRYGNTVNFNTGAIIPVNTAELFPAPAGTVTALTGVKFTQALSDDAIVFAGKLNLLDGFIMPFTGARALDGFWNLGMAFPVVVARTVPYSTLGAGGAILKNGEPIVTVMVLDTNNTPTTSGFQSFFNNGATLFSNVTVPTEFFGRAGHQGLSGTFSTGQYSSLQPTAYFDPNAGLVVTTPLAQNSWSMFYSGSQALWVDPANPKRMWGVFTNIGLADNGPSPIRCAANVALYGNSPLASRPLDTFGAGYGITQYSSPVRNLAPALLPIANDQVVEMFYSFGVTKWFTVSPDLQVVIPARGNTLPPNPQAIDTSLVLGVRAKIDF